MACNGPSRFGLPVLGCCQGPQGAIVNMYAGCRPVAYAQAPFPTPGRAYAQDTVYSHLERTFYWTKGPYVGESKTVARDIDLTGKETITVVSKTAGFDAAYADEFSGPNAGESNFSLDLPSKSESTFVTTRRSKDAVPIPDWSRFARHLVLSSPVTIDQLVIDMVAALNQAPFKKAVDGAIIQDIYAYNPVTKVLTPHPWGPGSFDDEVFSVFDNPETFDIFGGYSGHALAGIRVTFDMDEEQSADGADPNAPAGEGSATIRDAPTSNFVGIEVAVRLASIIACKSLNYNRTEQCEMDSATEFAGAGGPVTTVRFCGTFGKTAAENASGLTLLPETHEIPPLPLIPDLRVPATYWPFDLSPANANLQNVDGNLRKRIRKLYFKDASFRRYSDANPACCTFINPAP